MQRIISIAALCLLTLAAPTHALGRRSHAAVVSFHLETQMEDNPKMITKLIVPGRGERAFRKTPDVSGNDVQSFGVFSQPTEQTYGAVFRLKDGPRMRLSAITAANQGMHLLAAVNGRAVDVVQIDGQINDGCLVIWKGLTLADIKEFDKVFQRVGENKSKTKKK